MYLLDREQNYVFVEFPTELLFIACFLCSCDPCFCAVLYTNDNGFLYQHYTHTVATPKRSQNKIDSDRVKKKVMSAAVDEIRLMEIIHLNILS